MRLEAEPGRFKRYRPAPRKWVQDGWHLLGPKHLGGIWVVLIELADLSPTFADGIACRTEGCLVASRLPPNQSLKDGKQPLS
jgi:hypothetical protein